MSNGFFCVCFWLVPLTDVLMFPTIILALHVFVQTLFLLFQLLLLLLWFILVLCIVLNFHTNQQNGAHCVCSMCSKENYKKQEEMDDVHAARREGFSAPQCVLL